MYCFQKKCQPFKKNLNYIMLKHRHAMHVRVIFWGVGGLLETL